MLMTIAQVTMRAGLQTSRFLQPCTCLGAPPVYSYPRSERLLHSNLLAALFHMHPWPVTAAVAQCSAESNPAVTALQSARKAEAQLSDTTANSLSADLRLASASSLAVALAANGQFGEALQEYRSLLRHWPEVISDQPTICS